MFRTVNAHGRLDASKRRFICRPCEQTARDATKRGNRWRAKARDVIRRHAQRLKVSKTDLVDRYGWSIERLAHDAQFQYDNGCSYCGEPYLEMGHGLGDITLDVQDPSQPPYYRTNTKWCCQTCNRKKGAMTPESFELNRRGFEWWRSQRDQIAADPQSAGLLF